MGYWENLLETLYAIGAIQKIYLSSDSGSVTSAAPDVQTVINKSTDSNSEFIIKRFVFWAEDATVSFQINNFGPSGTWTAAATSFDLGFTLRPIDKNVVVTTTTTSGAAKRYNFWLVVYKMQGSMWDSFRQTFIEPIIN